MSKASLKLTELTSALIGTELEGHGHDLIVGLIGNLFDQKTTITEDDIVAEVDKALASIGKMKSDSDEEAA